ncbi:MAG: SsrA-binding protein SmpB [Patescibacteria group bacterium]
MSLIQNKKVHFNYEILERYESGIELLGIEVKAVRAKHGSLEGAHIIVRGGEAFLIGATINPYQPGNTQKGYEAMRNRKLLLTKTEISELAAHESKKGLTIVPVAMYNKRRKIKVEIAVVKGKKLHDKRETMKKRESERDVLRDIKQGR